MVTCGVQGRVTANLILTSLQTLSTVPNILPLTSTPDLTRAHVQPYTILYPYTAERRRTRPYLNLLRRQKIVDAQLMLSISMWLLPYCGLFANNGYQSVDYE
jgi:hypothetical protein